MNTTQDPGDRRKADLGIVRSAVAHLAEHFDTVQVFVTRRADNPEDGTHHYQWGAGNWFARYGQIRQWSVKEDEEFRDSVRKSNSDE